MKPGLSPVEFEREAFSRAWRECSRIALVDVLTTEQRLTPASPGSSTSESWQLVTGVCNSALRRSCGALRASELLWFPGASAPKGTVLVCVVDRDRPYVTLYHQMDALGRIPALDLGLAEAEALLP